MTPAEKPTFWFVGVTTAQSSIMRVFPEWAQYLGLGDVAMRGIDLRPHDSPERYRKVVSFLKADPLSCGALVTTHKLDLFAAAQDMFDEIDPYAALMKETSCLSKRDGRFICHAKDPISSGLALDGFIPAGHFADTGAAVFSMGAGGSAIALTWHLAQRTRGRDRPSQIVVSDLSQARLDHFAAIHDSLGHGIPLVSVLASRPEDNDAVLDRLAPGALIVNATGLGKDAPGSPITKAAVFPDAAMAWDLNYRGDLVFLAQAKAQAAARRLQVEDGWTYFIHGWTQVIAEVFNTQIPVRGAAFDEISAIAARAAGRAA